MSRQPPSTRRPRPGRHRTQMRDLPFFGGKAPATSDGAAAATRPRLPLAGRTCPFRSLVEANPVQRKISRKKPVHAAGLWSASKVSPLFFRVFVERDLDDPLIATISPQRFHCPMSKLVYLKPSKKNPVNAGTRSVEETTLDRRHQTR